MKKELIEIALAVTITVSAFTIVPELNIKEPIKIAQAAEYNISSFSKNPDYRPLVPGDSTADIDNGYGKIYGSETLYTVKRMIGNGVVREQNRNTHGTLKLRSSSYSINKDSDITKYVTQATSPTKYLERAQFYYLPGSNDTVDNTIKGTGTNYYVTAPYDGQLRFRFVYNEGNDIFTGVGIYDAETNKLVDTKDGTGVSTMGAGYGDFIAVGVKKGRKYRVSFASLGGNVTSKFELFFIKIMDNNDGKKIYEEDKWYTYTANEDHFTARKTPTLNDNNKGLREKSIRVNITTKSKVNIQFINLNYSYENWKSSIDSYGVYKEKTLDSGIIKPGVEQRVYIERFGTPKETSLEKLSHTLTLDKGVYYLPISTGGEGYDFCFKYTVTPVVKEYKPTLNKYKVGDTKISGKCIPDSKVYVKINNKTYIDTTTPNGTFTVSVPKLKKGTKVSVYLRDVEFIKSLTNTVTV